MSAKSDLHQVQQQDHTVPNWALSQLATEHFTSEISRGFESVQKLADNLRCLEMEKDENEDDRFEIYCLKQFGIPPFLLRALLQLGSGNSNL